MILKHKYQKLKTLFRYNEWNWKRTRKEFELVNAENRRLQDKLNLIATFDAYNEQSTNSLVFTIRLSKLEIRYAKDANMLVRYLIDTFKHEFDNALNREMR